MSDALSQTVPEGWYPDPWGSTAQRWWDGQAWTENLYPPVTDAPGAEEPVVEVAPDPEPVAEPASEPEPPRRRSSFEPPAEHYLPAVAPQATTSEPVASLFEAPPPPADFPFAAPVGEPVALHIVEPATTWGEESAPVATPAPHDETPGVSAAYQSAPPPKPLPSRRELRELGLLKAVSPAADSEAYGRAASAEAAAAMSDDAGAFAVGESETAAAVDVEAVATPVTETLAEEEPDAADTPTPAAVATSLTVDPAVANAGAASDEWASSLKFGEVETFTAPPDAPPIFGDAPPVSYSQRTMRYQPLHGRTSAVWLIVAMPIVHAAAAIGGLFIVPGMSAMLTSPLGIVPVPATLDVLIQWLLMIALPLAIVIPILTLVLAFQDRVRLRLLGHDRTASPWWTLLSPLVYLIIRSVRVRQATGRKGSGPLTTYVCLYIAPAIAIGIANVVITAMDGAIPT